MIYRLLLSEFPGGRTELVRRITTTRSEGKDSIGSWNARTVGDHAVTMLDLVQ